MVIHLTISAAMRGDRPTAKALRSFSPRKAPERKTLTADQGSKGQQLARRGKAAWGLLALCQSLQTPNAIPALKQAIP
jgi:hypothetical protein